ncbi:FHA domain containing protein [Planktothrix serta PCC 8927]|uniref:FHA domain containing protein n=1 Tax=Planktothrix serta PCC 8927 TaxID=671068 RepID=A0A7Z9BKT4_9CYAN|nr:FHA domain-containing protein [Planktothrix serta]VXD16039.1 FHA domain containing protein [Planktothrix serta PCC 8927]
MQIRLSWQHLETGEWRTPVLNPPIALGRVFERMPSTVNGERVSRIVLNGERVSRFHGLITWEQGNLMVTDTGSRNGILINGISQTRCSVQDGDTLQIANYNITISLVTHVLTTSTQQLSQISFNPKTDLPDPSISVATISSPTTERFPPASFLHPLQVSLQQLQATGLPIHEIEYLTIGAGLGSFIWADLLRISGIKSNQIIALGMESKPYNRYQQLCLNSQIPAYERLRSNSDSCPDNIWGWPSYALREAYTEFGKGGFSTALNLLWQVFAEPTFAETYTPRSGNVFAAIDREANRIHWSKIYRYGRVKSIRKTVDGRYAIAYSRSTENRRDHGFILARYVHLATGYPAIQFLSDLQAYREKTQDFKSVVNAYENHQHIYEQLEQSGGTVIIRGRGIVASRILQRLYEARQRNYNIQILHLMRSPKAQGNQFEQAQRTVENHFEFQPFNWPKACWGGDLRQQLETANDPDRLKLLEQWGGTTTANRKDWRNMMNQGLSQGWYRITFGTVEQVERTPQGRTLTTIREQGLNAHLQLEADFIIDATGLDAKVNTNPLLKDLVIHYNLPLNALGRLSVANDFELVEMRSLNGAGISFPGGRMYAAGAITLGGAYAAVDSFLGLQYAALISVESLATIPAPGLRKLKGWRSLLQWFKWAQNQPPD